MQSELKFYQAGYEGKLELLFLIIFNIKYYEPTVHKNRLNFFNAYKNVITFHKKKLNIKSVPDAPYYFNVVFQLKL